jgi:outer membrane protein TolC
MSISKYFLIFIILLAQGVRAEPSLVLTLDSLANRIHRQNPDLAAARVRIQEALGRVRQAGRLANPELQLSIEHTRIDALREFHLASARHQAALGKP